MLLVQNYEVEVEEKNITFEIYSLIKVLKTFLSDSTKLHNIQ